MAVSVGVEGGGSQSQTLYPLVAVSVGVEGGGFTVSDPVSSGGSVCRCRGGGGHSLRPCILW